MDDLIEKENQQFNRQARYENEEQFPVVICTFFCGFLDALSLKMNWASREKEKYFDMMMRQP